MKLVIVFIMNESSCKYDGTLKFVIFVWCSRVGFRTSVFTLLIELLLIVSCYRYISAVTKKAEFRMT
jgi:hypothetical protein